MPARPELTLTFVNLGARDPRALAQFYARLLGGESTPHEPGESEYVVRLPGGLGVSSQLEQHHVRPVWPGGPDDQQMQAHLEIQVKDLEPALAFALECGAELAGFQPQDDVRVCLDPAGHPFCLYLG